MGDFKQERLKQIKRAQESSAVLVLDAHTSPFDTFATAAYIRRQFPNAKILMPVAGYFEHVPGLRLWLSWWKHRSHITTYPVFRKEENNPVNMLMKFLVSFYPKELTKEQKRAMNHDYIDTGIKALGTPKNFIVVAPYGSPLWFGKHIKGGVLTLLKNSKYWIVTGTKVKYLRSKTQIGNIVDFSSDMDFEKDILKKFGEIGY